MRRIVARWLLAALTLHALLGVPAMAEEYEAAVEAFIQKTGVEADDALRQRIADYVASQNIHEDIIDILPEDQMGRVAEHLSKGWPISYEEALTAERVDWSGDVTPQSLHQLVVTRPEAGIVNTLVVNFDLGVGYFDPADAMMDNVCRAQDQFAVGEDAAAQVIDLLTASGVDQWQPKYLENLDGMDARPGYIALVTDLGTIRYVFVPSDANIPSGLVEAVFGLLGLFMPVLQ